MDSVIKWLKVKSEMRQARKLVLEGNDLNENSLEELEKKAQEELEAFGGDYETESGVAYIHEAQVFLRKVGHQIGTQNVIKWRSK